jgi:hypothetical protein
MAMTNKAIEICVTLLSLYLIVELNNIPKGARARTRESPLPAPH